MELKLVKGNPKEKTYYGLATKEDIEREAIAGRTHIIFEGCSHFVDVDSETERSAFQKKMNIEGYKWFHETTGDKNWVLYNPNQYTVDKNWEGKNIIKFDSVGYDGSGLETPINASSLCGLFQWMRLPANIKFSKYFNLDNIIDLSLMFTGCIIPNGFKLDEKFNTENVEVMRYMFYKASIPSTFSLGENFLTYKCKNFEYMFSRAIIPENFSLGANFTTLNAEKMNNMFYETMFKGMTDFGDKLKIYSDSVDTTDMFKDIIVVGYKLQGNTPLSEVRKLLKRSA